LIDWLVTPILFLLSFRQCLGESLAKAELFLVFANLIKHFKFAREEQQQTSPSTKRVYGLTVSPQPYRCVITRRKAAIF
jgi:cytochrome P450